jgi:hypothetical protein
MSPNCRQRRKLFQSVNIGLLLEDEGRYYTLKRKAAQLQLLVKLRVKEVYPFYIFCTANITR